VRRSCSPLARRSPDSILPNTSSYHARHSRSCGRMSGLTFRFPPAQTQSQGMATPTAAATPPYVDPWASVAFNLARGSPSRDVPVRAPMHGGDVGGGNPVATNSLPMVGAAAHLRDESRARSSHPRDSRSRSARRRRSLAASRTPSAASAASAACGKDVTHQEGDDRDGGGGYEHAGILASLSGVETETAPLGPI
jgi:hypothetical protein